MAEIELSTLGSVIKTAYEGEADTNAFDDAAVAKLAGLEDAHFKGVHVGLAGLEVAHPTGAAGDYAVVDDGVDLTWYQWDAVEEEWVPRAGESTEMTPAQVKSYYESNPDTNAFSDDDKVALDRVAGTGRFSLRRVGTWEADTNTPTLQDGTGTNGDYYVVTKAGTQYFGPGNRRFELYDWIMFSGGVWNRIPAGDAPTAVANWDEIQDKPSVYVTRGPISPPIPALYARNSAAVAVPNNTSTDYPLNADVFDSFGMLSDGKMVVPAWANRFRVTACINFAANATGRRQASVFVNGGSSTTTRVMAAPDAITSVPLMTPIRPVNPGDILDIKVFQTSGVELDVSNTSWVQVELFEAI